MEQQQKKKRTQSKSTLSFPPDLTSEILLRLPEKSVARFRCVSKLWSSITTDPYFINLFETRSPRPSLLLYVRKDDKLFVFSIPQHTNTLHQNSKRSYSSSQPIDSYYQMKIPYEYSHFPPTESVHGLICFQESGKPVVWNPSKRQFLTLPKPRKSWNDLRVFLGYDPVECKHKVVCMPLNRSSNVCRVLTLGSAQESWRTVKINQKHHSTSGRCIKGVIYYIAYIYHTSVWVIMSFDVNSEKFDMIKLPSDIQKDVLITYKGRVACVDQKNCRRLWVLEDAEKHKWSSQDFHSPFFHANQILKICFTLVGFTHDGEVVFVPSFFLKSSCILFCDPVRNSWRRFKIADDEFWLSNGFENRHMHALRAFPNHIESQISL